MRNIELKARLFDRARANETCVRIGAESQGDIQQTDTYFAVPNGRLKLRECDPGEGCLVFYHRADVAAARASDYHIEPAGESMGQLLKHALGVLGVVRKTRALWLWKNVRIHLDRVEDLGEFIEFEAVLSARYDDADGIEKLAYLRDSFEIRDGDLETGSYLDLLHDAGANQGQSDRPQ